MFYFCQDILPASKLLFPVRVNKSVTNMSKVIDEQSETVGKKWLKLSKSGSSNLVAMFRLDKDITKCQRPTPQFESYDTLR